MAVETMKIIRGDVDISINSYKLVILYTNIYNIKMIRKR